jgi:hypothetical protein
MAVIVLNVGERVFETSLPLSCYTGYVTYGCKIEVYRDNNMEQNRVLDGQDVAITIQIQPLEFVAIILRNRPVS